MPLVSTSRFLSMPPCGEEGVGMRLVVTSPDASPYNTNVCTSDWLVNTYVYTCCLNSHNLLEHELHWALASSCYGLSCVVTSPNTSPSPNFGLLS